MHKLVIMIHIPKDPDLLEQGWPDVLHLLEGMPGLRYETTSRVDTMLYGGPPFDFIHELYFDSLPDLQAAMASPQGREAGRVLQGLTAGRLTLFLADHKEDNLENIAHYRSIAEPEQESDAASGG
jgi:uncharacterized protein (TIGR02118 family)